MAIDRAKATTVSRLQLHTATLGCSTATNWTAHMHKYTPIAIYIRQRKPMCDVSTTLLPELFFKEEFSGTAPYWGLWA